LHKKTKLARDENYTRRIRKTPEDTRRHQNQENYTRRIRKTLEKYK
jgi:hypothetical protein